MQDAKRADSHFRSCCRIAVAAVVSVFLACSVCAQNPQWQKECETLFSSAVNAERQNDFIEAELRYDECRMLAQKHRLPKMEASALHRLGVIRARSKKFSESANFFRRAIDLDPRNALLFSDYAQLHADRKDYTEAENLLKKALDVEPNNSMILFNLGSIIASQRGERQAEGLRYLKLAVGEAEAYRELARIYRSKGEINRAEFAEQKAQLAGSQPASSGHNVTQVRPPHQAHTPPEVVNRNRHELIDIEAREMVDVQQRADRPTVGQTPFIPAPVNPAVPQKRAAIPAETAAVPAAMPVDPFASAMRPHEPAASPVRKLESPLADAFAQTSVRIIPKHTESAPVIQSSSQNSTPDPFAPVQTPEQLLRIVSPAKTETRSPLPQRSPSPNVSPIQVLPGGVKPYERTSAVNPLRQTLHGESGLIDPAADVSTIAALPSYSAMESKKMPRIDQSPVPTHPEPASEGTEIRQLEQSNGIIAFETAVPSAPKAAFVSSSKPLPVRDVDVLQSPSAVVARRESSGVRVISPVPIAKGNTSQPTHLTNISSMPSGSATLEPESVRIIQGEHGFASANTPNILAFDLINKNQSAEKSTEIASVQPFEQNTSLRSIVRLPETPEADSPKTIAHITVPTAPAAAVADPFPVLAEIKRDESSVPATASPSLFSQAKNITPLTQVPSAPATVAVVQPGPAPATASPSLFSQAKNITPLTQVPSAPAAVAAAQPNPFLVQDGGHPKFAAATPPAGPSVSALPATERPRIAASGTPEPLPKVSPVPAQIPPQVAVAVPAREVPQRLPAKEESTGFASTRKPAPAVIATSEEQPGFARSRK